MGSLKNIFTTVLLPKQESNSFDLSHDVKYSFRMGHLVPCLAEEVLPGDKWRITSQNLLRFAPLVSPVMHRVRVSMHFFFVPNRILWDGWEDFITNTSEIIHPYATVSAGSQYNDGSIADYLGFPTGEGAQQAVRINPFPFAAYTKIWDEFYRDQNLQTEVHVPLVDGDNTTSYGTDSMFNDAPLRRAWQHDYFTSCLPFAQKGDAVQVPLTTQANLPVELNPPDGTPGVVRDADNAAPLVGDVVTTTGGQLQVSPDTGGAVYDPNGTLSVDVQSDAVDINTLRRAFRLQEWLERNARGGTRYIEQILSHFGVKSSDARLQRPEYLGGLYQNMVISEVLSTAQTNDSSTIVNVVGNMAGHGISVGAGSPKPFYAEEHGWIIGIINVQPDTAYQQGLPRKFSRADLYDYAWPSFANLGEQEVLNKEVQIGHTTPDGVFGYIPRYAEYKYANSRVSGEMRTSLAFWHLGRIFATDQALNADFITCNPDTRIFAVTDEADTIYAHTFFQIGVRRKLPRFGIPTI